VIVMNKITPEDEGFLSSVMQKTSKSTKIIVVHNFTEVNSLSELEERIRVDLAEPFRAYWENIIIKNKLVPVYVQHDPQKSVVHLLLTNGNPVHKFDKINENTSDYIEASIENSNRVVSFGKYGPISRFIDYVESNLGEFVANDKKQDIQCSFDEKNGILRVNQPKMQLKKLSEVSSRPTRSTFHEEYERPEMMITQDSQNLSLNFEIANLELNSLKVKIIQKEQNKYQIELEGERVIKSIDSDDEKEDEIILRRSISTKLVVFNEMFESLKRLGLKSVQRKYDERVLSFVIPFAKEDEIDGNWDILLE